jgi:Fe-S oxidoreductase
MDRSMANALCCGGGGGNFHTDILGSGETSAARTRVREAMDAGAEVLAVACPVCLKMLDDAVKDEGAGTALAVTDISGILSEAMG